MPNPWGIFDDIYARQDAQTKILNQILKIVQDIQKKEVLDMAVLDDLKANVATLVTDVAAQGTVIASAVTAINGITGQIAVLQQELADAIAANDPAAIQAASDAIAAQNQAIIDQTNALAAAIPANTPAQLKK